MLLIIANFKKFCRFILVGFKIPIRFRKLEHGVKNPPRLSEISLRQKALADETKRVYARAKLVSPTPNPLGSANARSIASSNLPVPK